MIKVLVAAILVLVSSVDAQRMPVKVAEGCYGNAGEPRDSKDLRSLIVQDYEHWVAWREPNGTFRIHTNILPRQEVAAIIETVYFFDTNLKLVAFENHTAVENRAAKLTCNFRETEIACSGHTQLPGEGPEFHNARGKATKPYALVSLATAAVLALQGPWMFHQMLQDAERTAGAKTTVNGYDFAGVDKLTKDDETTVRYLGKEEIRVGENGVSAHKFDVDDMFVWVADTGLFLRSQTHSKEFSSLTAIVQYESLVNAYQYLPLPKARSYALRSCARSNPERTVSK